MNSRERVLAHLAGPDLSRYLAEPLEAFTPRTVTDAGTLLERLRGVRRDAVVVAGDLVIALDTDKGAYYDLYLLGQDVVVEPINFGIAMQASTPT